MRCSAAQAGENIDPAPGDGEIVIAAAIFLTAIFQDADASSLGAEIGRQFLQMDHAMGDAVYGLVVRLGGQIIQQHHRGAETGEMMLDGQDLAAIAQRALRQKTDFRKTVQHDALGLDPLDLGKNLFGGLAQFQIGGIEQALLLFGIQHIIYFAYIETLIPVWLPAQAFWAYLVTAAFLLSAISFFSGWKIGLASLLLGIMFGLWVVILHAPRAIGKGNVETEWSSLFVALGVCGVSLTLANRHLTGPTGRVAVRHAELAGDILAD